MESIRSSAKDLWPFRLNFLFRKLNKVCLHNEKKKSKTYFLGNFLNDGNILVMALLFSRNHCTVHRNTDPCLYSFASRIADEIRTGCLVVLNVFSGTIRFRPVFTNVLLIVGLTVTFSHQRFIAMAMCLVSDYCIISYLKYSNTSEDYEYDCITASNYELSLHKLMACDLHTN